MTITICKNKQQLFPTKGNGLQVYLLYIEAWENGQAFADHVFKCIVFKDTFVSNKTVS